MSVIGGSVLGIAPMRVTPPASAAFVQELGRGKEVGEGRGWRGDEGVGKGNEKEEERKSKENQGVREDRERER